MKKVVPKIVAIVLVFIAYNFAKLPLSSKEEKESLASEFAFDAHTIQLKELNVRQRRVLNPSYEHIEGWISSVGASASFTDLTGNGRCNDLILVDPRTDKVYWLEDGVNQKHVFDVTDLNYSTKTMAPMGTTASDFDENGEMDVLVYYWGRTPVIFYQHKKKFIQKELTRTPGIWNSNACTLADFNGDGHTDILVGNYFPDEAKILDANNTEEQKMQHSMSRADNGGRNRLFIYDKKSATLFTEAKNWLDGIDVPNDWTLALAAADMNGDLLPEIYVSNDFGPDKLLLNCSTKNQLKFKPLVGKRHFTTLASCVLGKDSFKGMGGDIKDLNNDGLLDIYVSNIAAEYALEESHFMFINTGETMHESSDYAPFENRSEDLGLSRSSWGWDSKMADFNNDGKLEAIQATGFIKGATNRWPELHEVAMGNDELLSTTSVWHKISSDDDLCGSAHNPFFVQSESGRFVDISRELKIDDEQVTRGLAISDMDHDGDLDFVAANQWESSNLYENKYSDEGQGNNFIGLHILKNSTVEGIYIPAIGCQVKVLTINAVKLPKNEQLIGYVDGGNGHSGVNSHEVFFGLGTIAENAKNLVVEFKWIDIHGITRTTKKYLTAGWHSIYLN